MRYEYVPFLAIKEKRKELLPEPAEIRKEDVDRIGPKLRYIITKGKTGPTDPKTFFIEANIVSLSFSAYIKERWAKAYADLSVRYFEREKESISKLPITEFLSVKRPYDELKLYHLEVWKGEVDISRRIPLFLASKLYTEILQWLEKIEPLARTFEVFQYGQKYLTPPTRKKGNPFLEKLINAVGIPDGRKRILYYWLIPFWVTVEGRSTEEVVNLALQWIEKQGGKVYTSWITSEAENVRSKGIKPWSLDKVSKIDKELIEILRRSGVL